MYAVSATKGRLTMTITAQPMGPDFNVSVFGGDSPHVGATALAHPHMALHEPAHASASCSVLTLTGHKEDELARHAALKLAKRLNTVVNVACGVHLNHITPHEIQEALTLVDELLDRLAESIDEACKKIEA